MELAQAFEDKEVRQLLVGGEKEVAQAFAEIDTHLRKRFIRGLRDWLRKQLQPEDLADIWQETLRDLLRAVRARDIDPERELCPRLWTIFIRRAFDGLRRRDRYLGMLERIKERLTGTALGGILRSMDEEERARLLSQVRQAVGTLPGRQRRVIETFLDHFPESERLEDLRRRVSEATGCEATRASVKRALQEARRKISDVLQAKPL